jgi:hypothetical protein
MNGPITRLSRQDSELNAQRFVKGCAGAVLGAALLLGVMYFVPPDRPVDYKDDRDHFWFGSIGSDIAGGLPLKVVQALPKAFPEYLPPGARAQDYSAFGFISRPGHPMPIGFSVRRRFIDFTSINCAVCHTGSVRESGESAALIVPGMPSNTVDLIGFFNFLFRCAHDPRFTPETITEAMAKAGTAGPLDGLLNRFVVPSLKDALDERSKRVAFLFSPSYPTVGPGRVDTFDTFKVEQFAYFYQAHGRKPAPSEMYGTVDFPSVWNQSKREGLHLHWDGNNTSVRERNFSAALGAGATPATVDVDRIFRVEAWLRDLPPPNYPFPIDTTLAARGAQIYREKCFDCHDFKGRDISKVVALSQIGTDPGRVNSYTQFLLEAQKDYTKGFFWQFSHFKKTDGYSSHPLDGIWARAPYLHNGSVPSLEDLLRPAEERPLAFTVGSDIYDPRRLGFSHAVLGGSASAGYVDSAGTRYTDLTKVRDTRLPGNGNQGHSGPAYGTDMTADQRAALIEYFKWQDRPNAPASARYAALTH